MELIPLGTSSASIVRDRGLSAYVLRSGRNIFLFDCGDGTQFRLLQARVSFNRIRAIFLSHLHGDHYLGLFGLLISMSLRGRTSPLTIVAPYGFHDILAAIPGLRSDELSFRIQHVKLGENCEDGEIYKENGVLVSALPLDHGRLCFGFRVEKKSETFQIDSKLARSLGVTTQAQFQKLGIGENITTSSGLISPDQVRYKPKIIFAYISDTRPCETGTELAKDTDLMIHEATFSQKDRDRAASTGHSTAIDAASVAKAARSKRLLLTHFSSRYSDVSLLQEEAKTVFPHSEIAQEFHEYTLGCGANKSQNRFLE